MIKLIIANILTVLLYSTVSYSQEQLRCVVFDKETDTPIEYVYILNNKGSVIAISEEDGSFNLDLQKTETITLRKFGYKQSDVKINNLTKKLFLEPKITLLDEVIISAKAIKNNNYFIRFYFKTYDIKNNELRRFIDGVVEFEIDEKKGIIKNNIIQYRSFSNDSILEGEKRFIQVTYEGTKIVSYPKNTLNERILKYQDYSTSKELNSPFILNVHDNDKYNFNKSTIKGKIFLNNELREKSAYLLENNNTIKTKKTLGSRGRILFRMEEEHFNYENDFRYLSNRKVITQSIFKQKKKENFDEYESFSEITFLEINKASFNGKYVKRKRDKSNYFNEFWKDKRIAIGAKVIQDKLKKIRLMPNIKSP